MPPHRRKVYTDANVAWSELLKRKKSLERGVKLSPKELRRLQNYRTQELKGLNTLCTSREVNKHSNFLAKVRKEYRELCIIVFSQSSIFATRKHVLDTFVEKTKTENLGLSTKAQSFLNTTPAKPEADLVEWKVPSSGSVERVFPHKTVEKIRTLKKEGPEYKAVTMGFPQFGDDLKLDKPYSCIMTLEHCDEHMKELMMALFNLEVDFSSDTLQGFQVLHESGLRQTMPCLSVKGGQCDKILEVFGKEIQLAITKCKTYKDEHRRNGRTMCISAVWVKGEGRVTLEMDVDAGLEIAQKLYKTNN